MIGTALVLPAGSIERKKLSGDKLELEIVSIAPQDGDNVIVRYPDGYEHHHQAKNRVALYNGITNVLKYNYNLDKFDFLNIFDYKIGEIIEIGEIIYGS